MDTCLLCILARLSLDFNAQTRVSFDSGKWYKGLLSLRHAWYCNLSTLVNNRGSILRHQWKPIGSIWRSNFSLAMSLYLKTSSSDCSKCSTSRLDWYLCRMSCIIHDLKVVTARYDSSLLFLPAWLPESSWRCHRLKNRKLCTRHNKRLSSSLPYWWQCNARISTRQLQAWSLLRQVVYFLGYHYVCCPLHNWLPCHLFRRLVAHLDAFHCRWDHFLKLYLSDWLMHSIQWMMSTQAIYPLMPTTSEVCCASHH